MQHKKSNFLNKGVNAQDIIHSMIDTDFVNSAVNSSQKFNPHLSSFSKYKYIFNIFQLLYLIHLYLWRMRNLSGKYFCFHFSTGSIVGIHYPTTSANINEENLSSEYWKKARDDTHSACDSQSTLFKFTFSFLGQKIAFKNINQTLEDFSKYDPPFKSTVF